MTIARPSLVDEIIADVLKREGGWVNDPADLGGPTNRGITLQRYSEKLGRPATIEELKKLTEKQAADLYREDFVVAPGFDRIADPGLANLMVDSGVHHGPEQATKWLQRALGVKADGKLGPVTLAAIAGRDPEDLFQRVFAQRLRLMGSLITRRPEQFKFAAGWMDRMADYLDDNAF